MAGAQGPSQGHRGLKRKKANPKKGLSQKLAMKTRVVIGAAFDRWRALKEEYGLKTDAEVAERLLDEMEQLPSASAPSEASDKKMKFSKSEVQALIKQEICSAVQKKEARLQSLIEHFNQLDGGVDFESSIQRLEARINTVTQRAEAALACMTKKESPARPPVCADAARSDSEDESAEGASQNKGSTEESEEVLQKMETAKKTIKEMRADNEALTADTADLKEELSSPVLTPNVSHGFKEPVKFVKKEPEDHQEKENHVEECKQFEEARAESVKTHPKDLSPGDSNSPKDRDCEGKLLYPPLPSFAFPSILNMEAASHNIPQKLKVRLALIMKPPSLSVSWTVSEQDASAPPMDSYKVLMTMEKVKGGGVFPTWRIVGEVVAIPLPMCVMISKYKRGHRICVAVVGKDKFGRHGPHSDVVVAAMPD